MKSPQIKLNALTFVVGFAIVLALAASKASAWDSDPYQSTPGSFNLNDTPSGNINVGNVGNSGGFTETFSTGSSSSSSSGGGSSSGGSSSGSGGTEKPNKTVSQKPVPPGLLNNTKLLAAIEKVLEKGNLNQNAIDNLIKLSNLISAESEITRSITSGASKSDVTTKIKYTGAKFAKNYVVYEKVPKSFANSSDLITVSVQGAKVEIIEKDPEYAITFGSVAPNQELVITYTVNKAVALSALDSFSTEVYAESLGDVPVAQEEKPVCIQVITPARNPATGECKEFATPCDVPAGWVKVASCPVSGNETGPIVAPAKNNTAIIILLLIIVLIVAYYFADMYSKKKKN